jgi:hypothetical protein
MPRVSTADSEVPKRAPRRRVASTRAPRKTVASADTPKNPIAKTVSEPAPATPLRRKSPTKLPTSPASPIALYEASRSKKNLFVSGSLFMLGLAIAAGIGYSDDGVINTASVISERNAQLAAGVTSTEEGATSMLIPVQDSASGKVDGGLVSGGDAPALVPVVTEVATSTGTSTEAASSTDAVTSEESAPIAEADTATPEGESSTEEAASPEAAPAQ